MRLLLATALAAATLAVPLANEGWVLAESNPQVPHINPKHKLFFVHYHKAAGTSFLESLEDGLRNVSTLCPSFKNTFKLSDEEVRGLKKWWQDEPNDVAHGCLQTNEHPMPKLIEMIHSSKPRRYKLHANEPKLITMFREPYDRCVSHWGHSLLFDENAETYKHDQQRFVLDHCNNFYTKDFDEMGINSTQGIFDWMKRNVAFWGITERYADSICLLHTQMGLDDSLSRCEQANKAQVPIKNAARKQNGNLAFKMGRHEFSKTNAAEFELYKMLKDAFLERLEAAKRFHKLSL